MSGWCEHCQNTGYLDCNCGGDLCVCDNNGEYECPHCDGVTDDDYDDFFEPPTAQNDTENKKNPTSTLDGEGK